MVVRTGFEPIQRESKSLVLPLHHRTVGAASENRTHTLTLEESQATITS